MKTAGTIEYVDFQSSVLQDNPLGDPYIRELPVYLPPSYSTKASTHYPVVWVLAPFTSWGDRYFNLKAWDPNIIQRYEALLSNGDVEPVIMAFPDCFTKYGGSQYVNSSAVGDYRDYVIKELVPFIDSNYRTFPDKRGVMGYSSGGYGALALAMAHPGTFQVAASHSGDMGFDRCYTGDIPGAVRGFAQYNGLDGVLDLLSNTRLASKDWFAALHMIAMSACYSPNPDRSLGIDLPFDIETGVLIPDIWQRWIEQDPIELAQHNQPALKSLDLLYFDCGVYDEFNLFLGARQLHQFLDAVGINHIYEEFEGTHRDNSWRYETSLPLITKALATG